jgi:hypothetical protein
MWESMWMVMVMGEGKVMGEVMKMVMVMVMKW